MTNIFEGRKMDTKGRGRPRKEYIEETMNQTDCNRSVGIIKDWLFTEKNGEPNLQTRQGL